MTINLANNTGDYYFEVEHIIKDVYNNLHYEDDTFYNNYEECLSNAVKYCNHFLYHIN
jgi:hypothetical protein